MRPLKGKHLTTMCDTCRSENPATHERRTVSFQSSTFCSEDPNPSRARGPLLGNTHGIKVAIYTGQNFSACYFPLTGGAAVTTSDHRGGGGRSGNFPSARALRTDLSRPHTHAQATPPHPGTATTTTTSLLHSHKSARISRNISPILRETWSCGTGLVFSQKLPPLLFLNEKREKKEGRGWCVVVRVPQSPPPFWWRERV